MISVTVFLLLRELKAMHKEMGRMSHNQSLFSQDQKQVLLTNGRIAGQTGVLELRQKELTEMFPELRKEIGTLKVKLASVSAVSTVSFGQQKQIIAQLRDSVSWVAQNGTGIAGSPPLTDTLRYNVFSYHDEFYDVSGIAHQGQQLVNISSRDTMNQVVFRKRKNPWLWIFSPKVLEQRVYFKNPNAHILYSRTINIQR
jgi:ribosomal protein L29